MKKVFFLIAFLLAASSIEAATYWVATSGSDSNSCSSAQNNTTPKRTIAAGISCMSAGDTLTVRSGTYSEGYIFPNGTNGLTIKSETKYGATWKAPETFGAFNPGVS